MPLKSVLKSSRPQKTITGSGKCEQYYMPWSKAMFDLSYTMSALKEIEGPHKAA
jgi:hypothetical protein